MTERTAAGRPDTVLLADARIGTLPPEGGPAAQIVLRGITKRYRTARGATQEAVAAVDLDIPRGQFVSLLGPSGCGKTTLLKMIGGLIKASSGDLWIDGEPVENALRRRAFGFVFQDATLLPWKTVLGNASLLTDVAGLIDARERIPTLLRTVGLDGFADFYPWQLSGGMRQRVALARALALEPAIMLMDEPFAALDALTRDRMGGELLKILDGSRTVVLVTHSIPEAVLLSDRVVVLSPNPGRIVADVTIDLPRPRSLDVRRSPVFSEYEHELRSHIQDTTGGLDG